MSDPSASSDDETPEPGLSEGGGGDSSDLLPLVYQELRRLAQHKMQGEGSHGVQTLTATALVHEAYLRISKDETGEKGRWSSKRHFFGAAAEAMRRILIDRARAKQQIKRGGDLDRVEFAESAVVAPVQDDDLLAVDEALAELEAEDPDSAELVKLRYFAGMTWAEITEATGIPDRTIRRQWSYARAWLGARIKRGME